MNSIPRTAMPERDLKAEHFAAFLDEQASLRREKADLYARLDIMELRLRALEERANEIDCRVADVEGQ